MNKRYANIGDIEDRVIEECAEVIQAITKIKRFGLHNYHPDRPRSSNKQEVLDEMNDARACFDEYERRLTEQQKEGK